MIRIRFGLLYKIDGWGAEKIAVFSGKPETTGDFHC